MWISDQWKDYELLDCSNGERLERWGKEILVRPDPQAIWKTERRAAGWKKPSARSEAAARRHARWVSPFSNS